MIYLDTECVSGSQGNLVVYFSKTQSLEDYKNVFNYYKRLVTTFMYYFCKDNHDERIGKLLDRHEPEGDGRCLR